MTEDVIHVWHSSPKAFALRCLGLFLLTNLLLFPGWPIIGGLAALVTALCLSVVYMFVLDDFTDWLRHRKATWTLTPVSLIYENPHEDMQAHSLSLMDITALKPRFWWSLVLRLSDGQAVTMSYISDPRGACDLIRRTKDQMV